MNKRDSKRNFAFVVPTLSASAAQNEDVVQILIFAAAKLEQEITARTNQNFAATIISVEHDTAGWQHLSSLFSKEALKHLSIELLEEPATPNLAIASHKPAYNFFEFLKDRAFDEVHCLDRYGLAYYPTQAKRLGLYFLDTVFAVHVVGGTIFRQETEDQLLDDLGALMDDLLERGSLERADAIYAHDRKAWRWYGDKIETRRDTRIYDLAWAQPGRNEIELAPIDPDLALPIVYYGPLGPDGGLPLFCDAVGRALPQLKRPVEVCFIGSPQAVGGMDAVSYIRLRSAKWGVPVTIKRELSIPDEIAFLFERHGVIVCDTVRREGLRARLIAGSDLPVLAIKHPQFSRQKCDGELRANPGQVAQALVTMLQSETSHSPRQTPELVELWRTGRPDLANLEDVPPSPPLQISSDNEPKVSVCVTHFSRPKKLRTALESLKQQTYRNFEVIVIDDGSPEPKVQRELAQIKREIEPLGWRLLIQENRYLGAARNFGASQATGDYLIFMDDDNAAKPHEISTLMAVAQRTGADIVTTFYDAFETESDLEDKIPAMRFTPFGSDPTLGILTNCYGDANALYSRQIFEQLGGFTEDYGITHEDWEFFCRASLEEVKLVCVPEPLFWYRVDQEGMFRGQQTQLRKNANLRRHIRPFLEKLPYYQAKLVQLTQGLTVELPLTTVGEATRSAAPMSLRDPQTWLPYARVAVITRTKDRPILLRRAVRSVLDQTFKDWLLVIVNDGGRPENVELVVDEVAEELAGRILVLHHPVSLGMETASNAGLSSCDSDFIIIHDDDDTWEPTFLARTISHLDEQGWNPKLGGVITWSRVIVEEINENGEITTHNHFIFNDKLRNISLIDLAVENCFPPISFLFRRAALEVVGPFKEQRHGVLGDWEFHLRLSRQFDIDVIPEPLANYHHRTQTTTGLYSNSVHIQKDRHHSTRVALINSALRDELAGESGMSFAYLLTLGELHRSLMSGQDQKFQQLHDYIWTVEQHIKYISSQLEPSIVNNHQRNLALNGDFRLWPGIGQTHVEAVGEYAYVEVCPGFVLCYDGHQTAYEIERRKWTEDGVQLPFGKKYLHLANDGTSKNGSWFTLECIIPSVLLLSGQTICISGTCRFVGARDWILIGGRYHLGDGRQVSWPNQRVLLPTEFERWSYVLNCPAIEKTELRRGHNTHIFLIFPHDEAFEFDLTDFQIEAGATPTEFQYNGALPLRQRLAVWWGEARSLFKKVRTSPKVAENNLSTEVYHDRINFPEVRENILARRNS